MQGFILEIRKSREEDLLVCAITESKIKTMYRFYGARHSSINLGYKIDFVAEQIQNRALTRLRDVTHLGYKWLLDRQKLSVWQTFCSLLREHLKDVAEHDGFYFDLLERAAARLERSSAKRTLIELYIELLEKEGRLHPPSSCFFCSQPIKQGEKVALGRGFLPSHEDCVFKEGFSRSKIADLFKNKNAASMEEYEIEALFSIMSFGL